MPNLAKRKETLSSECAPSPKRGKGEHALSSPVSSPIKGPLQEHTEINSPSFVATCFYGFKKSRQGVVSQQRTPVKKASLKVLEKKQAELKQMQDKKDSSVSPVEKLMAELIAASPVKQSLYESCSRAEFRKLYRDEYKQLEEQVRRESSRVTRRTSRIVRQRSEESDSDSYNSSDNEAMFEVNNNGLDTESGDENFENINTLQQPKKEKIVQRDSSENGSLNEGNEKVVETSQTELSNPLTPEHSTLEKSDNTRSSSSGKRFFKTRTPFDNSKMYGVVCGKGFNLKVVPKKQQKKSSPQNEPKKMRDRLKSPQPPNSSGNSVLVSEKENGSTDSAALSSPTSGFWFAPGFLSPGDPVDDEPLANGNVSRDKVDPDLSVNKSNQVTYQRTPPKMNILSTVASRHESESPLGSVYSSLGSVDLLRYQEPAASTVGSGDLFSSQTNSPADRAKTGGDNPSDASTYITKKTHPSALEDGDVVLVESETDEALKAGVRDPKLFPVFTRRSARLSSPASSRRSPATKAVIASPKDPNQVQMILDAGQKKFGATQCAVCCMVYCHADPDDEAAHSRFHKSHLQALKYPNWKSSRVIQEYPEEFGQMILVLDEDPKYMKKKVEEVNRVMKRELGFSDNSSTFMNRQYRVFLYVYEKEIVGCCVAEPIKKAYRILPGDMDMRVTSGQRPWRCSSHPEPACVGINRLWVAAKKRRTGVATKLVDCVRQWFDYGTLTQAHLLAFSDPTPDGRRFAQKYMNNNTFLVYNFNANR